MRSLDRQLRHLLAEFELFSRVEQCDPQAGSIKWFRKKVRRTPLDCLLAMFCAVPRHHHHSRLRS